MPRKAAPGLPAAKAEIRKLKAKLKEFASNYEEESGRRIAAESEHEALLHQIRQAKPIADLESVNFDRTPAPDKIEIELSSLYDLIKILDAVEPLERYRLLSMLDARYYDPPATAR